MGSAFLLDMFTLRLTPQLQDSIGNFILQLNGSPSHWSANLRDYFDEHLPRRWIGQVADITYYIPNDHPEVLN
ncbi:hypothetical protein TNCV_3139481 [Trichonephila clavipes]|nr:hypothetical protein TNCV_3139481 [Trichonephila clavipes]